MKTTIIAVGGLMLAMAVFQTASAQLITKGAITSCPAGCINAIKNLKQGPAGPAGPSIYYWRHDEGDLTCYHSTTSNVKTCLPKSEGQRELYAPCDANDQGDYTFFFIISRNPPIRVEGYPRLDTEYKEPSIERVRLLKMCIDTSEQLK